MAKKRKSTASKPALRAPTPRRARGKFSRNGHVSAVPGGKTTAPRPLTKGDASDRLASDFDAPGFEDEHDLVPHAEVEVDNDSDTDPHGDDLGSNDGQIDDPVRMYLMQMGEIPLLTRAQEIDCAKRIEYTRRRFRHSMLASDFLLQGAVSLLEKVRDGELRLDRTIEVSVTNTAGKKKIMLALGPEPGDAGPPAPQQSRRLSRRHQPHHCHAQAHAAWRRLVSRRNKAVRLIEELNLRTGRLQPLLDKLGEISRRMVVLRDQLVRRSIGSLGTIDELRNELRYLMRITLESPATLHRRSVDTVKLQEHYDAAKRVLSAGNLAAGGLDRQEISQPRPELSWT